MPIQNINADELRELIKMKKGELEIIDVRQPEEYEIIHIKGSKLIPLNEIQMRMDEIDFNKDVIFLCRSGSRSAIAAHMTAASGRNVKNLGNGICECYKKWNGEDLEIKEDMIGKYF